MLGGDKSNGRAPRQRPRPGIGGYQLPCRSTSSHDRRLVKTGTPGIYKRGSRYVVVFRDPNGRQRKRSARTLAEARDLKAALTADVRRGEYRALSKVTFADYAAEWIEQLPRAHVAGHPPRDARRLPPRPRARQGRQPDRRRRHRVLRADGSSRRSSRAT